MNKLVNTLSQEYDFSRLIAGLDAGGCPAVLSGIGNVHKAHACAALQQITDRPVFVICADEAEAKRLAADIECFSNKNTKFLPEREFTFYNAESISRQTEQDRIKTLYEMVSNGAPFVISTIDAVMQRTIPAERLSSSVIKLEMGGVYDLSNVEETLVNAGYSRSEQVEGTGQFAVRGGILDFFSPAHDSPIRCEFFGDEIDSMGYFDITDQRRTEVIKTAVILPCAETQPGLGQGKAAGLAAKLEEMTSRLLKKKSVKNELIASINKDIERITSKRTFQAADRYIDLIYESASAADYISSDNIIVLSEPSRIKERAANYVWQMNEDIKTLIENGVIEGSIAKFYFSWDETLEKLAEFPVIMMDNFVSSSYPFAPKMLLNISAKQLPSYAGSMETAASDIAHYKKVNYRIIVLCEDKRKAEILGAYLAEHGIENAFDFELAQLPEAGMCVLSVGTLSAGFEYPELKLAVITEGQLYRSQFKRKAKKKILNANQRLESFSDLSPGDLVVHEHYGIGRFVGIVKMLVDKIEKDYVKIAYAGTDSLYVPATQLDLVSKYIGAGEDKPVKLSKMGGNDWIRAKTRAKSAAKELAKGLIALQAERKKEIGYAFSPDSIWQTEFEDAFGYQETDDQIRCVQEIKEDMERPLPMDRLLCGDVGYGKTEVALRAVMKCVLDGKQAAILVPTTVLAQQHYFTAIKRFAGYPVHIEVLSRFRSASEMKKAIGDIKTGAVDIVIGTHRLLQKDIVFKNLGLLIVDEEQRFGVAHKERLKEIARNVDVLTLSATPIPRTLNMALSGIRDMSTIEEPPEDRQPVQTYVLEHDWTIIGDAIKREITRGGQVYYLHNRVDNIERTAARLAEMLDGVSVSVAHGQMNEEELSSVMERMAEGEVQVLVCTTIIETGIDIPNVNTLVIEDADRLGLAQLHQIRGRVGRSNRRAFAYLTFRHGKVLTEVANKRLSAVREFAEFNSGFKIAMRDLEIRGAGNLLGPEQSGHMMSVGYDMYLKLLEEAVLEEKGEKIPARIECSADLSVSANIPERYIASAEQRMDLYRRIAHIRSEEDADDITDEMIDRYGDPPKSVNTLIHIALMRSEAAQAGISEISQKTGILRFKFTEFELKNISELYQKPEYKGRVKIEAGNAPVVSLKLFPGNNAIDEAVKFAREYKKEAGS